MKKLTSRLIKVLLAGAMLAGCSGGGTTAEPTSSSTSASTSAPAESEAPQEKVSTVIEGEATTEQIEKIVYGVASPSTDASPFSMNTPTRPMVKEALYATLFFIEPEHFIEDVKPYIGKSITKVDDYTWDIEIFDNIKDSKGNPITANDVLWSYEWSFKNQEFLVYGTDVEYLKVVDDTHLQLKTTKTVPGVIEKLVTNAALTIVNQEWFENAPDEEKQMDPACTGPYKLVSHVSGSEIVVEARDDYWKTDASVKNPIEYQNVKTIEFKVLSEAAMRAIALENQEVDFVPIQTNDLHRFYDEDAKKAKDGYNVWIGSGGTFLYNVVFLNMDKDSESVFANDINLRKAALYAISPEDVMLASGATLATGTVVHAMACEGQGGYLDKWNEDYDYYNYDPEVAHEFYKASGHADGEVTVRFLTSISIYNDSVRSVIIANLEEAGFSVETLAVDSALMLKYRFDSSVWDLEMCPKLAGDYVATGWDGLFNPVGYSNGSVNFIKDDKLVELLQASVMDASDENTDAFHEYLVEQAYCKALYYGLGIQVAQGGVLEMARGNGGFLPEGSTFSKDFVSAPNAQN